MKRKLAVRPIRRTTPGGSPPLETAAAPKRAYPDATTLASAIRAAAMRATRVLALPALGLTAGCMAEAATPLPIAPLPAMEVGKVVEGLKPPVPLIEIVPMQQTGLPVQITPVPHPVIVPLEAPPRPAGDMPAVLPDPDPPQVEGGISSVRPDPPPPPVHEDPPMLRGRVSNVRPTTPAVPGGIRAMPPVSALVPTPVPSTLSDDALAAALASIAIG